MGLNSIGPSVLIVRRGDGWCVRFRLPEHIAKRYSLPRRPRLTARLPEDTSRDRLVREANRIGAMLDMLLRERDAPADGQSLAAWLGLPEPVQRQPARRAGLSKPGNLWPDVVNAYAIEYRSRTLSREGNEAITLGRLDRIAAAFPKGQPDDISARQWSQWLDGLDTGVEGRNRLRSLASRVYKWGLTRYMCESNPLDAVVKRKAARSTVRHAYMTLSMIEAELARREYTPEEEKKMRRWRVLDEREQKELMDVVLSRPWTGMVCPVILALHGVSGIDIRTARKAAYDPHTGIFTGQRTKRGAAPFSVPIAPALKPHLDRLVVSTPDGPMFPHLVGCTDPKGRMLRLWAKTIAGTEFEGLRMHALRHSFISTLIARGVEVAQIAKFVGHLEVRTTVETYGAFLPDNAVELVASLKLFEAG